jgi:hypothetical protein
MKTIIVIVALSLSMSGCIAYSRWQESSANADILAERAAILKLYRLCLEKNQDDPAKAKSQCEHYTQSLQAIDVRGVK